MPVVSETDSRPGRKRGGVLWSAALISLVVGGGLLVPFLIPVQIKAGGHGVRIATQQTSLHWYPVTPQGFSYESDRWIIVDPLAEGGSGAVEVAKGRIFMVRSGNWFYQVEVW